MKFRVIILIAMALTGQSAFAGDITDTYTAGDTLTAVKMDNIKTAVNGNAGDISTNIANININASNISSNTTRIVTLENAVNVVPVTRRIYINTYGVNIAGAATFAHGYSDSGSIIFPEGGDPQLDFNFMVPEDNVDGSDLVLEIIWRSTGTTGNVLIRDNWGTRQRVGTTAFDFSATNGPAVDTSSSPIETIFKSEITFSGSTLSAGDYVSYGIFRRDTSDTSTDDVVIGGLSIRYTATR